MQLATTVEGENLTIRYDFEWLYALIQASSTSMVPYSSYLEGCNGTIRERSYPRSVHAPFWLGGQLSTQPSSGGRNSEMDTSRGYALLDLLRDDERALPLSDIAILSKRAVCVAVRETRRVNFTVSGGTFPQGFEEPAWGAYGYPMLCIIGHEPSDAFPKDQAEWRVVQCVFGAVLTRELRERGVGLEVISREGFGSLFPTLADLPNGIRLDPGLIPPDLGAESIDVALTTIDEFISENPLRSKSKNKLAPSTRPDWVEQLNGMNDAALHAVDRLMSRLHEYCAAVPGARGPQLAAFISSLQSNNASGNRLPQLDPPPTVTYTISAEQAVLDRSRAKTQMKRRSKLCLEDDGYGSESDYEDDFDEVPRRINRFDTETYGDRGVLSIKKVSVLTGMAALRMATFYALRYASRTEEQLPNTPGLSWDNFVSWSPYFELDYGEIATIFKSRALKLIGSVLVCDGAPNPINIPRDVSRHELRDMLVTVIDTTNNTTREKAQFLAAFRRLLRESDEGAPSNLLLMVDSVSKHPTGGDLVHGVIRICGHRAHVTTFFKHLLGPHLTRFEYKARELTVLSGDDSRLRRAMSEARIITRNLDLWQQLETLD